MHILILNTIHIVLDYSLVKSDLIVSRVLGVFRVAMRVAIVTMFPILLVAVSTRTVMARNMVMMTIMTMLGRLGSLVLLVIGISNVLNIHVFILVIIVLR